MTKKDVRKIAEDYVMKHKEHYTGVPKKEIKQAVEKVTKALSEVAIKEPTKTRAKSA
jgi:hypothetical protein